MVSPHIAVFHDPQEAKRAVDDLVSAGVRRKDISVLMSESTGGNHFGIEEGTKASEVAAGGAAAGGALGLAAGLLITAATGGVGIFAVGPILVGLAGMGAGALVGGVAGALSGMGVPEHEAKYFEQEIMERNAVLVGVDRDPYDMDEVSRILRRSDERRDSQLEMPPSRAPAG